MTTILSFFLKKTDKQQRFPGNIASAAAAEFRTQSPRAFLKTPNLNSEKKKRIETCLTRLFREYG
jgi:hypothetical protein